jgi:hypothetical protein
MSKESVAFKVGKGLRGLNGPLGGIEAAGKTAGGNALQEDKPHRQQGCKLQITGRVAFLIKLCGSAA